MILKTLSLKIINLINYQPQLTIVQDPLNHQHHTHSTLGIALILAFKKILKPIMPIVFGAHLSNMCKITLTALNNNRMDSTAQYFVVLDPPNSQRRCHSMNSWEKILSSEEEKRINSSKNYRKRLSSAHSSLNLCFYSTLPFSMNSFMSFKMYGKEAISHIVKEKASKHQLFPNSAVSLDFKENRKTLTIFKCMMREIHHK